MGLISEQRLGLDSDVRENTAARPRDVQVTVARSTAHTSSCKGSAGGKVAGVSYPLSVHEKKKEKSYVKPPRKIW